MSLWTITEQLFQMLGEYLSEQAADANLLTPGQVKRLIDEMLATSRFNDEFTASVYDTEEIRRLNPIDRKILQLIYGAKRLRAQLVKNDISEVLDEVHELSAALNIPIKRGSINEKIVGREMLRAIATYYEESADRERQERDLPDDPALKQLSLDQLRERISETWRRGDSLVEEPIEPSSISRESKTVRSTSASGISDVDRSIKEAAAPNVFSNRLVRLEVRNKPDRSLHPDLPTSAIWNDYIRDLKDENKRESPNKLLSSVNLWNALHGESSLKDWNYQKAKTLRTIFLGLPGDYSKAKQWRGKSLVEIRDTYSAMIENAIHEQNEIDLRERCTKDVTWNRHRAELTRFWEWGKKEKLTGDEENPFNNLWIQPADDTDVADGGSEERLAWDPKQISDLFSTPLFTGCKSKHRRHLPGAVVIRDALYWVPLIIAFTGMRREELCQLKVRHLQCDDQTKIWHFDLKARGLKLKNTAQKKQSKQKINPSKRWIPLPSSLLDLHIIDALHAHRNPEEQLFPELYKSSADRFGDKLGQRFGTYRKNYDEARIKAGESLFSPLYERLRDLHSFRHSFCTELVSAGVPQAHAEELSGHKSEERKTEFARYDKGRTLEVLKRAIDKRVLPINVQRLVEAALLGACAGPSTV